ncbi:MAG TPA: IS4 family transposase, partial [Acidobacteriaceae bacterium]|nr:IS4 family transposase [Acidobacteriaceae bacterium]
MRAPAGRRVPRATRPLWPGSRQSERDGCGAAGRLERTGCRCGGRHGLAIQDTSAVHFRTAEERRRGLGEIGHGTIHGLLVHAMLALDAATGSGLGLVGGRVWTRSGPVTVTHNRRAVADTASERWIATALRAKDVLAAATMVTAIADRASELDAQWAMVPAPNFHLLTRVMPDPRLANGVGRYATGARVPAADTRTIARPRRAPDEPGRTARLTLRFGTVAVKRPRSSARDLPPCVRLTLVEIVKRDPPAGVEPLHWRRLTTHAVPSVAAAWQIVAWDKLRWVIEQLFRILKTQGLHLEDSQIASAERRLKLATIATKSAALTLQLVQARDGRSAEPASLAFTQDEMAALEAVNAQVEGRTEKQKNPHLRHRLAWAAAWIIAHLGGWDGYRSSRPPGPITFKHGLEYFRAIVIVLLCHFSSATPYRG